MSPLRLGIAGCGRIAERGYLPALAALPAVRLAAVADPDPERRASCLDQWRQMTGEEPPGFPSVAAMLDASAVEALAITAPASSHVEIAAEAAAAGVPALVEKPPAPSLDGARRLAALDPAPAIGFNRRFRQGAELAPAIPADGWLELDLELRFRRGGWAAHVSDDEALLDAGTHLVDLACFLAGAAPIAVRGAAIEPERASLELELGRGRARIACATDRGYAERVDVRDRGGGTVAASRTDRLRATLDRLRGREDPLVTSLRAQLTSFAAIVAGGEAGPLAGAEAGVAAMAAVEAARRSAALNGAEVTVAAAGDLGVSP